MKDAGSTVYLRPETAQGIFLDFKTTLGYARRKPPFGIAQVGKSFRNEITPGNFIFRTLEFEQMEMEFFVPPAEAEQWHEHWMEQRMEWYVALGLEREKLRLRPHGADELSHYSSATSDIEYLYPIGWSELEGIANRGDFDLKQHAEHSGQKLDYVDTATGDRYVPHVIEPAAGVGRTVLALLCDAYHEDDIGGEARTVLRLQPSMAPVKVAVLPLVNKAGMPERAREIYEELRPRMPAEYDAGGSIGKRYRRQDEIGTPYGVTVDGQTIGGRHGHRARPRHARAGARAGGGAGGRAAAPPGRSRGPLVGPPADRRLGGLGRQQSPRERCGGGAVHGDRDDHAGDRRPDDHLASPRRSTPPPRRDRRVVERADPAHAEPRDEGALARVSSRSARAPAPQRAGRIDEKQDGHEEPAG